MTKDEIIREAKTIIIDHTEECFMVTVDSDDIGTHYSLHLVRDSVDILKLRKALDVITPRKRFIIMLYDEEYVKFKLECSEKENARY